jgi:hypothetical protein
MRNFNSFDGIQSLFVTLRPRREGIIVYGSASTHKLYA